MNRQFGFRDKSNRTYEEKLKQEARIERFERKLGHHRRPSCVIDTGYVTKEGEPLMVGYHENEEILTDLSQVNRVFNDNHFIIEYDVIDAYDYAGVAQLFPSAHFSSMYMDAYLKQNEKRMRHIQLVENTLNYRWNRYLEKHTGMNWEPTNERCVQLVMATSKKNLDADVTKMGQLMQEVIDALRGHASGENTALKKLSTKWANRRWGLEDDVLNRYVNWVISKEDASTQHSSLDELDANGDELAWFTPPWYEKQE